MSIPACPKYPEAAALRLLKEMEEKKAQVKMVYNDLQNKQNVLIETDGDMSQWFGSTYMLIIWNLFQKF